MKKIKYLLLILSIIAISFGIYYMKRGLRHNPHYIPAITVDPAADMSHTIVYKNSAYSITDKYRIGVNIDDNIIGTYIGAALPSIDEHTRIDKGDIYLAGTLHANVYRLNGYSDEFRLCTFKKGNDTVSFYENLNGIIVESGKDIFIDRLFFDTRFTWNAADIHSYPKYDLDAPGIMPDLSKEDIASLYNALINSEHILYEDVSLTKEPICTLSIRMEDNTIVKIHFFTENYISYDTVYFIMDDPIYDKIISLYR